MASLERIHYDFTEEETALLEKRKLEWQATDKPGRRAIATQVYDKLKNDNPDWDNVKKKLKKDGVHWWFHTFGRKRGSRERFDAVKRWNARMVVGVEHETELQEQVEDASNAKAGSADYFSCYQRELSKIWNGMSTKEQDRAAGIADRWNKIGPPKDEQLKNAEKHGFKYVRSFSRQLKKVCGMDCIVFTAHKSKDGRVQILHHDYMAELGGRSFLNSGKNWRDGDILLSFSKHMSEVYEMNDVKMEESSTNVRRKPYVEIETDENGHPVLPPREDWPGRVAEQKALIRAFVATAYRRATGSSKSLVPWLGITQNQGLYIEPEFVPEDFTLLEPTRLKEGQLLQLLTFWYDRQQAEQVAFEFKAYRSRDGSAMPSNHAIFQDGRRTFVSDSSDQETTSRSASRPPARKRSKSRSRPRSRVPPKTPRGKGKGKARAMTSDIDSDSGEEFDIPTFSDCSDSEDDGVSAGPSTSRTTPRPAKSANVRKPKTKTPQTPRHSIPPTPASGKQSRPAPRPLAPLKSILKTPAQSPHAPLAVNAIKKEMQPDVAADAMTSEPSRLKRKFAETSAADLDFPEGTKFGPPQKKKKHSPAKSQVPSKAAMNTNLPKTPQMKPASSRSRASKTTSPELLRRVTRSMVDVNVPPPKKGGKGSASRGTK